MAAFHVFVEGAIDRSPAGIDRLAAAIAEHYGLPAGELQARLAKGRFRVKGNCDRATAESYARDLAQLGARCAIESADAPTRPSTPAIATPPHGTRTTVPPASSMKSGLAAAFSAPAPDGDASLGALAGDGMLTLSSVDGADDRAPEPPASSFGPPPDVVAPRPASAAKPAAAKPAAAKPAAKPEPAAEPAIDMFAPPDAAEEAAFKVELEPEEVERAAKKKTSVPPATEPVVAAPAPASARPARVSVQPATVAPDKRGMANPNNRLVLGVLIAIVIGFVPAHLLASVREKSAYAEIDRTVDKTQSEADTPDTYDALDAFRDRELARKYDARRSAAILAFLVWAVIGGGVAYVWFRRIRWPED